MTDFVEARHMMVEGQVRTCDVTDLRVLAAMRDVPRERFVSPARRAVAYLDRDIEVGPGNASRRLLKPAVLAKLIQAAEIDPVCHVLDVGCATGYSSAILSLLASTVVALEQDRDLAALAADTLAALECRNVTVVTGPLAEGAPAHAPFDVIVVNGATEIVPERLIRQLKDGGRLVCVLGHSPIGKATVFRAAAGHATRQPAFDAAAPLLPGFAKPLEFVF